MSDELKQIVCILNSMSEEDRKEALNVLNQVRIDLEDKLQDQVYYDFYKNK